jgi:calcineurin-like phosphoesterase family protein
MLNTWFTSDLHLGHGNIIKYSNRPFVNTDEMDAHLINEINKVVKPDDTLVNNGDWLFGPDKINRLLAYRKRIACQNIVTIWGNHDDTIRESKEVRDCFRFTGDFLEHHFGGKRFTLCHYALRVWNKSHHGAYHLYGHSHGTLPDDPTSRSFDCGVDTDLFGHKRFTPYSLEEVVNIMEKHKNFVPVDHHNQRTNP